MNYKSQLIAILSFCIISQSYAQSVSLNTTGAPPDSSAVLDISSTDKGVLLPRLTSAERMAIHNPAIGLLVFDLDKEKLYCYTDSEWVQLIADYLPILQDEDSDTKIMAEKNLDEDIVRFYTGGTEFAKMDGKTFHVGSGEGNVFIGHDAGASTTIMAEYNTSVGSGSLFLNDSGDYNNALGYKALYNNALGYENVAIGYRTLFNNFTGYRNFAIGHTALHSNLTGYENIAFGHQALFNNNPGIRNIAIGHFTMATNTSGNENNVFGFRAMFDNTSGEGNCAFGHQALEGNQTGGLNSAFGYQALQANVVGQENSAFGTLSMYKNTLGFRNAAFGSQALSFNTAGYYNTAVGALALNLNEGGGRNVGIGYYANGQNINGDYNTIIGYEAGRGTGQHSKTGNVFLGYQAGFSEHSSNKLYIENSSNSSPLIYGEFDNDLVRINGKLDITQELTLANFHFIGPRMEVLNSGGSVFIGESAGENTLLSNLQNVFIGSLSGRLNENGNGNIAIGSYSMENNISGYSNTAVGFSSLKYATSSFNTALGYQAMLGNMTGEYNTGIGSHALRQNESGNYNASVGYRALLSNEDGATNTALGALALEFNISGNGNTAIGYLALNDNLTSNNTAIGKEALAQNSTGTWNVAIGNQTLSLNETGSRNVGIGHVALRDATGSNNVAVGVDAGQQNTGNDNVFIGFEAGKNNSSGSGNVFIGRDAGENANTSDKLFIDNSNTTTPLIYGDFANDHLRVYGNLSVNNGATTTLQIGSAETLTDAGTNLLHSNAHFEPFLDNTRRLGSSTNRWIEVWAADGTINTSDANEKQNIRDLQSGIETVMALRPVKFNWKESPDPADRIGLIAQEVQQVLPEVVRSTEYVVQEDGDSHLSPTERLGLSYSSLIPVLIKGMQDQQVIIDELLQRIEELESQ